MEGLKIDDEEVEVAARDATAGRTRAWSRVSSGAAPSLDAARAERMSTLNAGLSAKDHARARFRLWNLKNRFCQKVDFYGICS